MEDEQPLSNPNPNSSTVHPKHAAMLRRLSNRNPTKPSSDDTFESTPSFLSRFSQSKLSIESSISSSASMSDVAAIFPAISSLENLVAESSTFLPDYEMHTCLETIKSLKQTLDSRSSQIAPKKAFSFKTKKPVTAPKPNPDTTRLLLKAPASTFLIPGSPGFHDRENEVLSKNFSASGGVSEFVISRLGSCEVRLKGCFQSMFVHKLNNCKVYCGPVSGSVFIEEVDDCVFVLASHQIRIHNAKRCDFYLRVRSRPIIEDCESVRFAPYRLGYDGIERDLAEVKLDEENGNWGNVDDFKWLKGFQSPNWSVLPESERIGEVTISISDK